MDKSSTRSSPCLPTLSFNIKSTSSSTISNIAHQSATRMPACASSSFFSKTLRRLRPVLAVFSFQEFNRPLLRVTSRVKLLPPGARPTRFGLKVLGAVLLAAVPPLPTRGLPASVFRCSRSGCWARLFNPHLPNHRARPSHLTPISTTPNQSPMPQESSTSPLNPHLITFPLMLKL